MRRVGAAAALLLLMAGAARAQGVRITGASTAQYIDMRPLVLDSVPVAQAPGDGTLRQTADGTIVSCLGTEAYCHYTRPASVIGAVPFIQDVEVNAWGFTTGLRAYAQLRARAAGGQAARFWPSADRSFEALAAYLELDRGTYLARVGRQWKTSGLGFYNFDGASLAVHPRDWLTLEGFGGRSLVRGASETMLSSALSAVEPWAPDEKDWLYGAEVRLRPSSSLSAGALYQRDVRSDAAGLYGERVAADARLHYWRSTLSANVQTDLASGQVNEARVRLDLPRLFGIAPALQARHYQPYFELWTIWGAFSPVGYDEATVSGMWVDPSQRLTLHFAGGRRTYGDVTGGMASLPLRNDGWRISADALVRPAPDWTVSGGYSADVGFGSSRSDQTLGVRRSFGGAYLGLTGMGFQTLDDFRVERGRVWGASADAGVPLGSAARLDGSFQAYRHRERYTGGIDWNQMRGMLRLVWTIGSEPGRRTPAGGGR